MMTPAIIRVRLLRARQHAVKFIASELQDNPPANLAELLAVLRAEREAVQAEILRIQREREQMAYCGQIGD